MDDVIFLVSNTFQKNEYGVDLPTPTTRQVCVQVESITQSEFFAGGRNGLNPEYKFTMFFGDYQGESVCVYHDKQYAIYRTYHVPGTDDMELYAERKGGTNGA